MKQITIDITSETPELTFANVGIPGPQGIQGIQGEKGPAFVHSDFTPEQLAALKGAKGDKGDTVVGPKGIKGDRGPIGAQGLQGEKLTYTDLTDSDKDDLRQPILPYIEEAKDASADANKAATDAAQAASDAQAVLGKTVASGGIWVPATQEYPTVPTIDTLWLLKGAHTYTTGSLSGTSVTSGDQLFYDVSKGEWEALDVTFSGIATLNGKSGLTVTLTPADIGSYSKGEADAKFPLKTQLFSGNYNDLTNKPNLSVYRTVADSYSQAQVDHQFALKTQLFSESYNDLTDKPDLSAGALGVLPSGYSYSKSESDGKYMLQTTHPVPAAHTHTIANITDSAALTPETAKALGDTDLNTLNHLATAGFYFQNNNSKAVLANNYPVVYAGSLLVQKTAGVTQTYTTYGDTQRIFVRGFYGSWSPWVELYSTKAKPSAADVGALPATGKAKDSEKLEGLARDIGATKNTIAQRDTSGDISARLFRSSHATASVADDGAGICFRTNSASDNYMRFLDKGGIHNWLGRVKDSTLFLGKTLDQVKFETRSGLVPDTITVNNKRLNTNITITAADVGLGNVPNYAHTNSYAGTSTALLATQKAVFDAAAAPRLATDRRRKITKSTQAPTGGADGDLWIQL